MEEENVLDCLEEKLRAYITRFDVMIFGSSFGLAMLVHLYMFTHKFINHDDVGELYGSYQVGLIMGRWLTTVLSGLTGHFSSSWLNGVAGAVFLALACVLMARLFRLRRLLPVVLISVCLVAFPTVASTYAYMFCAAPFLFGLAMGVLGAVLIRKEKLWGLALGTVCVTLSMSCYQAFFPLTTTLLVTCLIMDVCDDRWSGDWKAFIRTALSYVAALAVGMLLYVVILQLQLAVTGTELTDYAGIDTMGQVAPAVLLERILTAFRSYALFFLGKQFAVFHPAFYPFALLCVAVNILAVLVCVVRKKLYRQIGMMIFLLLLLCAFPLSSSLIYVMVETSAIHMLMIYPLVVTLIIPGVILDRLTLNQHTTGKPARQARMALALALICLEIICAHECVLITNRAYFSMDITYENVYAYYTKLAAKIELQEGYTPDSLVALSGWATMTNYVPETGLTGVLVGNNALNMYTVRTLLAYFMASSYNFASQEVKDTICQTVEYQAMPCYPAQGSIATINDVIVVKFSN